MADNHYLKKPSASAPNKLRRVAEVGVFGDVRFDRAADGESKLPIGGTPMSMLAPPPIGCSFGAAEATAASAATWRWKNGVKPEPTPSALPPKFFEALDMAPNGVNARREGVCLGAGESMFDALSMRRLPDGVEHVEALASGFSPSGRKGELVGGNMASSALELFENEPRVLRGLLSGADTLVPLANSNFTRSV